jgi:hypothetical protein
VARLGDIGLEDRPCGGNQRLPRRFVARPRIEPELRTRIEAAAVERGMSVRDYAVAALQAALAGNRGGLAATSDEWSGLSHESFARDWESEADAVYDELA